MVLQACRLSSPFQSLAGGITTMQIGLISLVKLQLGYSHLYRMWLQLQLCYVHSNKLLPKQVLAAYVRVGISLAVSPAVNSSVCKWRKKKTHTSCPASLDSSCESVYASSVHSCILSLRAAPDDALHQHMGICPCVLPNLQSEQPTHEHLSVCTAKPAERTTNT